MRQDARHVVEAVLSQPLPVLDLSALTEQQLAEYAKDAGTVLASPSFTNELNTIIDRCVQEIVYRADDFERIRDLRMTINGLALLRERLQELAVAPATLNKKSFDPHAGI